MADFDSKKYGTIIMVPFSATNVTTGASAEDMLLPDSGLTKYIAPVAGSIIGITAATAAITAGGIQVKAHNNSTEFTSTGTPEPTLDVTNDTNGTYATVRPGAVRFAAGDGIGLSVTATTTGLDPTNTLDVSGFLHIALDA